MSNPEPRDPAILAPRPEGGLPAPRPRGAIERGARPGGPVAPNSNGMPNALELVKALRHRWGLALGLGLVCGGLAASATWAVLPTAEYSAQALLHVAERQPQIIFQTGEAQANFGTYQQTQLILLRSRPVLNAALREEAVATLKLDQRFPDPVAWLEKQIQANYTGEVLRISMSGPKPDELAILVNSVTEAYINEVVLNDEKRRRERHETLKDLSTTYQERLETRRKEFKAIADQLGSTDRKSIQFAQQLILESRELAKQDLLQVTRKLQELRIQLAVRNESKGSSRTPASGSMNGAFIEEQIAQDPEIDRIDTRIAELHTHLERQKRLIRRPSDPAFRETDQAIRRLQDRRDSQIDLLRGQMARQAPPMSPGSGSGDLLTLKEEIRILEELEHLYRTEVAAMDDETRQFGNESWMLDQVQDDLEQIAAAAQKIRSEVEALNVELKAPERVNLFERAENPRLQADKRPKMAGMAGVGAFGLTLLGVSLLEHRTRRIHSVDEVIGGLQLRLVGALPALPSRRRGVPVDGADGHWRNILLESVDAIRTLLLRASAVDSIRSVMITSAVAGEGKTSLASHLATSLARAGRRTLLVDCDLRKPDVHRLFDIVEAPGLSELLRGETEFDDAIHTSPAADLWILPAGATDERAIQALSQPGAEALFDRLRDRFDFVIVDTAPVLPVADSLLVGQYVDGAIYSVLRSTSRAPKVHAAGERLRAVGVRIIGAVMTGVRGETYGAEYSSYAYAYPGPARSSSGE